jgi:cell division septum initiation protein DivIVA
METSNQQQIDDLKKQLQTVQDEVKMLQQQNKILKTHLSHAHEMARNSINRRREHQDIQQFVLREKKLKIKIKKIKKKNSNLIKTMVNKNETSHEEEIDFDNSDSEETSD